MAVESWHQDHSQPLRGHPVPIGKWGFFTSIFRSMAPTSYGEQSPAVGLWSPPSQLVLPHVWVQDPVLPVRVLPRVKGCAQSLRRRNLPSRFPGAVPTVPPMRNPGGERVSGQRDRKRAPPCRR